MPPRSTPTARQQRLGFELRKLRERADMSATEAAATMSLTQSRVSNIEMGRYGVSADRVRMFARTYNCSDAALIDALTRMTSSRSRYWWDEYRDILTSGALDLAEVEHHAKRLRSAQFTHLPGLLQTIDYARLVLDQAIPKLSPPELEHLVSHRMKRQGILYGEQPTPIVAVIHEAALRMQFGGPEVMRKQLQHIAEMSEKSYITILVLPFSAGVFPGTGQTVVYAEGEVPQLDTVQLDTEHGSDFLYAPAQLERYRTFMDRFEAVALNADRSRDVLNEIAESL